MATPNKLALVIVFDGIEEVEALTTVDILRRASIDVTVASVSGASNVTGRNNITFAADISLSLVAKETYDLVVLPGGPGVLELAKNLQVREVLKAQNAAKRDLAAICAAPKILAKFGLLNGSKATSHFSVRNDLPHPIDEPVVEDENITTSQGLGTAVKFALTLVKRLKGEALAKEIADSIHFQHHD